MSVTIDSAEVLDFVGAPNLLEVTPEAWYLIIGFVNTVTMSDDDVYTIRLARIYLAAHLAFINEQAASGAAGPVTSEAAGGLRRSYGLSQLRSGAYALETTQYGQSYLSILAMSQCHGPFLV